MRLITSIRKFGFIRVIQTIFSITEDYFYDRKYGLDTFEKNKVTGVDPDKLHEEAYFRYQPTRFRHFRKLMQQIKLPAEAVFVDIGSGKGKVLLMACETGFRKIRGIELSGYLCQIAKENIASYERKKNIKLPVKIIESDIIHYQFDDDEQIFYLFNPFNDVIMQRFVDLIKASIQRNPRKIWLIFNNFKNHTVFHEDGFFQKVLYYIYGGTHFTLFIHK